MEKEVKVATSSGELYCLYKQGSAAPDKLVIMLHGYCATRNAVFFRQIPHFTKFSTLRFDLPGSGRSAGEFSGSLLQNLHAVQELLGHFPQTCERVLIGHSRGATLAMLLARDSDTLVLCGARIDIGRPLNNFYTDEELEWLERGPIVKIFGGKAVTVTPEELREHRAIDLRRHLAGKRLSVAILAAKNDQMVGFENELELSRYFGTGISVVDCDHFGFSAENSFGIIAPFLE